MSHIIKNCYSRPIGKNHVAVRATVEGKKLITDGELVFVKPDTQIAELPPAYKVIDSNGEEIPPSGKFYITVQTINPYHLIMDISTN